jgi:hypothetical protein
MPIRNPPMEKAPARDVPAGLTDPIDFLDFHGLASLAVFMRHPYGLVRNVINPASHVVSLFP